MPLSSCVSRRLCVWAIRLSVLAACLVFAGSHAEEKNEGGADGSIAVKATPVTFSGSREKFGRLTYRGGLHLTSPSSDFGGFSGLSIGANGQLMAISDAGVWLRAELTRKDGKLTGLTNARLGNIADQHGRHYKGKRAQDAEALRADSDGTYLISFEHRHRVGRFKFENGSLRLVRNLHIPSVTRSVRGNRGLEAVAILADGKEFAFFAERQLDDDGNHSGWYVRDGKVRRLRISRSDEFDITDSVALPDGSLLLLERRFVGLLDGVHMRLRLVSANELEDADVIRGEELFRGNNFGYAVDNMEGIDAYETEDGDTVIAVISDDNFNRALQRTLLLEFTLERFRKAASGPE